MQSSSERSPILKQALSKCTNTERIPFLTFTGVVTVIRTWVRGSESRMHATDEKTRVVATIMKATDSFFHWFVEAALRLMWRGQTSPNGRSVSYLNRGVTR
jgi:hypothetical protein